jgi:hypothetical protein
MRMTQLSQAIKGLPADPSDEQDPAKHVEECLRVLRHAKAYLWHGSPHRALQTLEDLTWDVGTESGHAKDVQDKLEEFMNYVTANLAAIPNYADRQRHGEPIATGFVEFAVNQVVSKRPMKKQQMRWTPPREPTSCCRSGLECSISICVRGDFERWHPRLQSAPDAVVGAEYAMTAEVQMRSEVMVMLHFVRLVRDVAPQIIIVDPAKQIEGAKHTPQFAKRPIEFIAATVLACMVQMQVYVFFSIDAPATAQRRIFVHHSKWRASPPISPASNA